MNDQNTSLQTIKTIKEHIGNQFSALFVLFKPPAQLVPRLHNSTRRTAQFPKLCPLYTKAGPGDIPVCARTLSSHPGHSQHIPNSLGLGTLRVL